MNASQLQRTDTEYASRLSLKTSSHPWRVIRYKLEDIETNLLEKLLNTD